MRNCPPQLKMAKDKIQEMLEARQAPGVRGHTEGPHSKWRGDHFDFFHAPTNCRRQAAQMETDGYFDNRPAAKRAVELKLAKMRGRDHLYPHIDYQKTGHPCGEQKKGLVVSDG